MMYCPASNPPLSCKWRGPGGQQYQEHVSQCVLVSLVPYVTSTQETISQLRDTVAQLQREMAEMKTTFQESIADINKRLSSPVPHHVCTFFLTTYLLMHMLSLSNDCYLFV